MKSDVRSVGAAGLRPGGRLRIKLQLLVFLLATSVQIGAHELEMIVPGLEKKSVSFSPDMDYRNIAREFVDAHPSLEGGECSKGEHRCIQQMVVDAMCAIAGDSDSCAPMSAVQLDAVGNNYPLRSELSKDSPAPLLNILTRSGNRRLLFEALRESLSRQTYTNIRHIVSNDNSYSTDPYLRPNDGYDVLSVSANRSVPAFYNLYIDTLAAEVSDGWIMIIDDDAKFIDETFLERLSAEIRVRSPRDILTFPGYIGKGRNLVGIEDSFLPAPRFTEVDMSNFCVHHTVLKQLPITMLYPGVDHWMLTQWHTNPQYNMVWIGNLPKGVWANYQGARHSKHDPMCEIYADVCS